MNAVVHEAINRQINAELTASYSYLQMSAFCARQAFNGCAHWLRLQSQEEYGHAMRLFSHSRLRRMALTGYRVGGAELYRLGIVEACTAPEDLMRAALRGLLNADRFESPM